MAAKKTTKKSPKKKPAAKTAKKKPATRAKKGRTMNSATATPFLARQGDVLVQHLPAGAKLPRGAKPLPRNAGRIVLADGKSTGHAHAIADDGADLFEVDGARTLRVTAETGVDLVHEEHETIHFGAGDYSVARQREWSGEDERRVED